MSAADFNQYLGAGKLAASLHFVRGYDVTYDSTTNSDSIEVTLFQFATPADAANFKAGFIPGGPISSRADQVIPGALRVQGDRDEVRRRLLSLLQAQGWVERRKAVELLGLMGDTAAVPEIAAMLDDPNEEVRWQAASMLRGYKTQYSIARLRAALTDSAWAVRARAAEALGRLGAIEAAVDFAPLLQSDMPRERCDAVYSLYLMNIERGAPEVHTLMYARGRVSDSIIFVLEVLEGREPADYIVAQLNSADSNRREKAAYFVSRREIAEALENLAYLLDDPVDDVLIIAMQSIAELNGIEYLDRIQSRTTHPTPFVRVIAALCCQLLGAKSAIPSLRPLLEDLDSEVRYATVRSLGALGASAEADRMANLLFDPVEKVRWQAAFALGRVGDESVLELLERAGSDPSTDVALAADVRSSPRQHAGENNRQTDLICTPQLSSAKGPRAKQNGGSVSVSAGSPCHLSGPVRMLADQSHGGKCSRLSSDHGRLATEPALPQQRQRTHRRAWTAACFVEPVQAVWPFQC